MEDVNLNQLKTVCNLYLECEFPYFEELREAFYLLDICGCRIEELFQINRWSYVSGDTVTLTPQKNNLPRTITLDAHTQQFKNCVINQTKPFLGRTSYQLQYLFRKLNPYIPIYSGGREISLYCYRYKHIWEAKFDGRTNEQIMNEMGHRTVTPILLYLAADINSTYYIEPYNPDPYPANHVDIITQETFLNNGTPYYSIVNPFTGNQSTIYIEAYLNDTVQGIFLNSYKYNERKSFFDIRFVPIGSNFGVSVAYCYMDAYGNATGSRGNLTRTYHKFIITHDFYVITSGSYLNAISTIKLWIDGVYIGQYSFSYAYWGLVQAPVLMVGCRRYSTGYIEGNKKINVKNFRIWNSILSNDDISKVFLIP